MALALGLSACAGAPAASEDTTVVEVRAASTPTPVSVTSFPGVRQVEAAPIAWQTDFEEARAAGRHGGRDLLVYVRADWSVSCTVMERELWPSAEARQAVSRFIPVMVDVTDVDDPLGQEMVLQLHADTIPAVVVVAADGEVVAKHLGTMTVSELRELLVDR